MLLPVVIALIVLYASLGSCNKKVERLQQETAQVLYTNLGDSAVTFRKTISVDINQDGKQDVIFFTQNVASTANGSTARRWLVTSTVNTFLLYETTSPDEDPVFCFPAGIGLPRNEQNLGAWYELSFGLLMERVSKASSVNWRGNWNIEGSGYLAVQVVKDNQRFYGWIEVKADIANERLILVKAAISKLPDKSVISGQ